MLLIVISLAAILLSSWVGIGCTTPMKRLETCVTDPESDLIHCDGKSIKWKDSSGMVCHRLEEWEEYMKDCR